MVAKTGQPDEGATARHFVLTGTPGAGKTSILRALAARGVAVVDEAATDVIAARQAHGEQEPWTRPDFVREVAALQRLRREQAAAPGVWVHDRSPICTHALCVFLGQPVPAWLRAELDRIERQRRYERQVFFVRNLGFVEPTPARRIDFAASLEFERLHEETYRAFGYQLIDIAAAPLDQRVAAVLAGIRHVEGAPESPASQDSTITVEG